MAWFALLGEFSQAESPERRGTKRRALKLQSVLSASRPPSKVIVLDLSEAGLMLHSHEDLAADEIFEVVLPEAGVVEAQVVWKRSTLYGCRFVSPVSRGMISAVLLRAGRSPSALEG